MLKNINGNKKNFKKELELILDKRKIAQKNKSNVVKKMVTEL